jgi:hypothetical protein
VLIEHVGELPHRGSCQAAVRQHDLDGTNGALSHGIERRDLGNDEAACFFIAFVLAAHEQHGIGNGKGAETRESLREHHRLDLRASSSSENTAMRSPRFVLSGRKPATIPATGTSASDCVRSITRLAPVVAIASAYRCSGCPVM